MKIDVHIGGSQEDEKAVHFTYWTLFGLGHNKHLAIYFPIRNTLEVHSQVHNLDKILNAFRKSDLWPKKPISVMFW